jgi:hypothetical protein
MQSAVEAAHRLAVKGGKEQMSAAETDNNEAHDPVAIAVCSIRAAVAGVLETNQHRNVYDHVHGSVFSIRLMDGNISS